MCVFVLRTKKKETLTYVRVYKNSNKSRERKQSIAIIFYYTFNSQLRLNLCKSKLCKLLFEINIKAESAILLLCYIVYICIVVSYVWIWNGLCCSSFNLHLNYLLDDHRPDLCLKSVMYHIKFYRSIFWEEKILEIHLKKGNLKA